MQMISLASAQKLGLIDLLIEQIFCVLAAPIRLSINQTRISSSFRNRGASLYRLDILAIFVCTVFCTNPGFKAARAAKKFSDMTADGACLG